METLSFIGAAQRLGVTVKEVEKIVKEKKLKEVSEGKVSKEAVYELNGLSAGGNQTKKKAGRPTKMRTAIAGPVPGAENVKNVEERTEEKSDKTTQTKEECDTPRYSKRDMKEVADIAHMKGKLSVYESMSEFKRKERV